MNRRAFIISVGGAAVLAGCTTTGNGSENRTPSARTPAASTEPNSPVDMTTGNNRIAVEDRRVSPGDTGAVSIKAKTVTKMVVSPSLNNPVPLDYENASFSPQIRSVAESYPPQWHWSSTQQNVSVEVPFRVPADTQSGTYNYSITISNESASYPDSATEEFTMTVT